MIKKIKFVAKEVVLRTRYIMNKDCIFCKIVAKEIKIEPLFENDKALAFFDINPVSSVHILIIPKRHIDSVFSISSSDSGEIIEMFEAAAKIVKEKKLDGFRLAFNGGKLQHVGHLHMHLLAGGKVEWKKL